MFEQRSHLTGLNRVGTFEWGKQTKRNLKNNNDTIIYLSDTIENSDFSVLSLLHVIIKGINSSHLIHYAYNIISVQIWSRTYQTLRGTYTNDKLDRYHHSFFMYTPSSYFFAYFVLLIGCCQSFHTFRILCIICDMETNQEWRGDLQHGAEVNRRSAHWKNVLQDYYINI